MPDHNDRPIKNEHIQEVVDIAFLKVEDLIERKKSQSALSILAAMSSYGDYHFNYSQRETELNNIITEQFKNLDLYSALIVFYQIEANEKQVQASRKLAIMMMKRFDQTFTDYSKLDPLSIAKLTEKFTHHKWLQVDTYNKILNAFSAQFNNFSVTELCSMISSLSSMGLATKEVFESSVSRIEWINKEYKIKSSYKEVLVKIFESAVNSNLTDTEFFQKFISDEFVKEVCYSKLNFFEHAVKPNVNHAKLLSTIIRGSLDVKDPRFKELVRYLYFH